MPAKLSGSETIGERFEYILGLKTFDTLAFSPSIGANVDLAKLAGSDVTVLIQIEGKGLLIPGRGGKTGPANIGAGTREITGIVSNAPIIREENQTMSKVRWKDVFALFVAVVLLASVSGCSDADDSNPSGVSGFNYTSYYIARFDVTNEDQNLGAGGGNIFPKNANEERSESGEMCCISIPSHWRLGMRLVVTWRRDTHPYDDKDRSGDQWLTATTEVPPYGPHTWGFWVHFLPGDRIRVQIQDKPDIPSKPDEHDPYIVQGKLDAELNKQETKQ